MSLKQEWDSNRNVTQNEMSLKLERHLISNVIQTGMSLILNVTDI